MTFGDRVHWSVEAATCLEWIGKSRVFSHLNSPFSEIFSTSPRGLCSCRIERARARLLIPLDFLPQGRNPCKPLSQSPSFPVSLSLSLLFHRGTSGRTVWLAQLANFFFILFPASERNWYTSVPLYRVGGGGRRKLTLDVRWFLFPFLSCFTLEI